MKQIELFEIENVTGGKQYVNEASADKGENTPSLGQGPWGKAWGEGTWGSTGPNSGEENKGNQRSRGNGRKRGHYRFAD